MHTGVNLDFVLWKNYRMRPFENKVLGKTLGHKKRTGEWRKMQMGSFIFVYISKYYGGENKRIQVYILEK
jgi:hypothetical protein